MSRCLATRSRPRAEISRTKSRAHRPHVVHQTRCYDLTNDSTYDPTNDLVAFRATALHVTSLARRKASPRAARVTCTGQPLPTRGVLPGSAPQRSELGRVGVRRFRGLGQQIAEELGGLSVRLRHEVAV